jgi:hypothetical protein
MLRPNGVRINGVCCGRQDTPQRQQRSATHVGQAVLLHRAANPGVEHPRWNLQRWRSVQFDLHATQNYSPPASRLGLNENALPIPRVPTVLYFSSAGFMGVSYPTCTTATVRTVHSTIARRWSSNLPSKGAGPWPGSLRQPQPATQLRIFSYEWLRKGVQAQARAAVEKADSKPADRKVVGVRPLPAPR